MGINLGLLARAATPGLNGIFKGKIAGEDEVRRREREQKDIEHQTWLDMLTGNREARDATTFERQGQDWQHTQERRPIEEGQKDAEAAARLQHENATTADIATDNRPEWQKDGYPDWTTWRKDQFRKSGGDRRPEWQKQGYPSFEDWRRDKETSAAPDDNPERARRKYLATRVPELKKSRTEPHPRYPGESIGIPGLSTAEAIAAASEEFDGMSGSEPGGGRGLNPEATIRNYIQRRGGVQAPSTQGAAPSAPTTQPAEQVTDSQTKKAMRWEELVNGGMTPEQATQKVMAEFGQ